MPQVMVVDDSRTQRSIINQYLAPLNCDVVCYESGNEALEQVTQKIPDLIILDVEMPGLSGFDTCKAIRGFLQEIWVPIVYLTARSNPEDVVEGLAVGGDTYVQKPVNPDVLLAISKAMLRLSDMQAQLLEANRKLDEVAHHDVLTQIMNRRGLDDMLERLWRDHQRRKSPLGVLIMDIDHFKAFNDNYGHIKGDECLRQVAQVLKNALKRPIDVIARYGGEEFVVLLPETDLIGATHVADRLINAINQANMTHAYSACADHVTVSVGVAQSRENDSTQDMIKRADTALYKAKELGRNQAQAEE